MSAETFHLIDERDVRHEDVVDAFRVAFWHGNESDPQDLTSVAVYESSKASLDETLEWAKRSQNPAPRLVGVFAVVTTGRREDSVRIARYDHRPSLKPGETRDPGYSEGTIYLHS